MLKKNNPFENERIRAKLAKKLQYKVLIKTYSRSYAQIQDFNTGKFWDEINTKGKKGKNPMDQQRIQIVTRLIKGNQIDVLNIGFGSASLEKAYFDRSAKKLCKWNGIDISQASVRKAKKDFPFATFTVGNIVDLQYKNNSFDYVVLLEVLEHIQPSNTLKALREIFRVIKPGKYFIISVPLNEGLEQMTSQGDNPNAHVRIYTPELIKAELEIAKFKILNEKTLFAFHDFYKLKTFIAKRILPKKFHPNNIIIFAQKPF